MTANTESTPAACREVSSILGLFGDKWTMPVVMILQQRPRRFNELRRALHGISQQMLTRALRQLERDGMVSRTVHPTVPPQVEYALTELGQSLATSARNLGMWARTHSSVIERNRNAFDTRQD